MVCAEESGSNEIAPRTVRSQRAHQRPGCSIVRLGWIGSTVTRSEVRARLSPSPSSDFATGRRALPNGEPAPLDLVASKPISSGRSITCRR